MFDSAEIGHKVSKKEFLKAVPPLREALLDAQAKVFADRKTPVIVLISGEDGAGKSETIHVLYEWMDARFITTLAFDKPTDEERERPSMWRYWRALPPKGRMGIFAGSWYSEPIAQRIANKISVQDLDARAEQINRFEAMLVQEGALVLKFWIHLTKEGQRTRLQELQNDPKTAWRVTPWNWDRLKTYDRLQAAAGHLLRLTNTPSAPWIVVEGTDPHYRSLRVAQVIEEAVSRKAAAVQAAAPASFASVVTKVSTKAAARPNTDRLNVLTALDLTRHLSEKKYEKELAVLQGRLSELMRDPRFQKRSLVLAFEGADAAGKGGAIRRITYALDPRQFQVIPVAAPTQEELAQPYLWRFWRHLPRQQHATIFDRSWYGRVLVERIEGFCAPEDWARAYGEINDFEHEMVASGAIVVKFWLQISQEEQLKRFKEREKVAFKRFKITQEDWRNRDKWDAYQQAICDMVEHTSTGEVPWNLIEANDKYFARIKIMQTLCSTMEAALGPISSAPSKKKPKQPSGSR